MPGDGLISGEPRRHTPVGDGADDAPAREACGPAGETPTDAKFSASRRADNLDSAAQIFSYARGRLFGIAYRMLGSASDAEDVLQDVWVRWQTCDRTVVREPAAFLATMTTRLAINVSQSAHSRRETYIGPWLPEPVNTDSDPALGAERGEALGFAILLLLEKLSPTERAAYILREAFDYPYRQIAQIVQLNEPAARQLVSRARKRLMSERHAPVATTEQKRLLTAFLRAAQDGDVAGLEDLFTQDVVSYSDGNGIKLAARIPVRGHTRVAKFIAAFSSHFWTGKTVDWVELNGQPSALLVEDGRATTAIAITVGEDGITQLMWMMSPEKLHRTHPA